MVKNIENSNSLFYSLIVSAESKLFDKFTSSSDELRKTIFNEIMNQKVDNDIWISNIAEVTAANDITSVLGDWNTSDCISAVLKIYSVATFFYDAMRSDREDLPETCGTCKKHNFNRL